MGIGLAKDTHTCTFLLEGINKVVGYYLSLGIILVGKHYCRDTCVLQTYIVDRQSHDGTEVQLKLREVGSVAQCHHARIMRTRREFGEHHASIGKEELHPPDAVARQGSCHLVCHLPGIIEVFF